MTLLCRGLARRDRLSLPGQPLPLTPWRFLSSPVSQSGRGSNWHLRFPPGRLWSSSLWARGFWGGWGGGNSFCSWRIWRPDPFSFPPGLGAFPLPRHFLDRLE